MNRFLVFLLMLALAAAVTVTAFISSAQAERVLVSRVKDGDTFELTSHKTFGLASSIRVRGIDTPEHDALAKCPREREAGMRAMAFTRALIAESGGVVWIDRIGRDKYNGRFLARVRVRIGAQRIDLAEALTAADLAQPYSGEGSKPDWCPAVANGAPVDLLPADFTRKE
jgi:endonuclease YncB( thermonuclease family)